MVTTTPVRVPLTKPLRDHIRSEATALMALLATTGADEGVYAADNLPQNRGLPAICIRKTAPGGLYEQLDQVLYRFDIWAADLATCEEVEAVLRTFLEAIPPSTVLPTTGSPTHVPSVLGIDAPAGVPVPDPDDGTPRLVVTATVTAKAVPYTPEP